jgi:sugar lactone lactonase YvrE
MLYPNREVRVFASGLDHPEGVAFGRDGRVYAGGEAGQVYRISQDGQTVETLASTGGFCLGITLDRDENIYVCDEGKQAIFRVTQKGELSKFADSDREGNKFKSPNFSVFDSQGNLYFSDSGEWERANGTIYRASPQGDVGIFAPGPFHFANGLALDEQERYLYVVETNLDRVLRTEIRPDGSAGKLEVFAEGLLQLPDGLAFDTIGNLYVTTYGSSAIYRISPDRRIELLCQDLGGIVLGQTTNCAFGGPDFDQLYVANLALRHISILDLRIKGQRLYHQK